MNFALYSSYIPSMLYSSYEESQVTMQTRLRVLQILLILCIFQKGEFFNRENN